MRRGFTLVEVLVVIVVVTVASAVAVPAILDVHETPLEAATNRITALLDEAHARAVTGGTAVSVIIDPAAARYWLQDARAFVIRTDTLGLPEPITMATSSPRLRFHFRTTLPSTGDTIRLSSREETRSISIDGWTGDVRVR